MIDALDYYQYEDTDIYYRAGLPLPYGTTIHNGIANFSINSQHATNCWLVLFRKGESKPFAKIKFLHSFRLGDNFSMMVKGLDINNVEYGYCFDGPYDESKGLLFDKNKILMDPYAKVITGHDNWRQLDYSREIYPFRSLLQNVEFNWHDDKPLDIPMQDLIIYEMHVRGYSIDKSSDIECKGTYKGIIEKIPYFKELGVNCIELLPVFDFDEREYETYPNFDAECNFWGYSTLGFFAPKTSYSYSKESHLVIEEFKNMVKCLHENGIEIILDVVFNHTAENFNIYSYKGIDNPNYYILENDGSDSNLSGCGNTTKCNHPVMINHIIECLHYWVSYFHIDGFRFDEASILARDEDGTPLKNPPLLDLLTRDPILSKTKLIAEAWDAGGLYLVGNWPAKGHWAEWNGKFRDTMRSFLRSDELPADRLVNRITGSCDLYPQQDMRTSINFITCHDGFVLNDLFCYDNKHNEANGEDNRDGIDNNISTNWGAEGKTDDVTINEIRNRSVKNALGMLFISRGTPMMLAGDEFRNTQFGNNNSYCQDNEISHLNWDNLDKHKDVFEFVKSMIQFRKEHPILRNLRYKYKERNEYDETQFFDFNQNALNTTNTNKFLIQYKERIKNYNVIDDSTFLVIINFSNNDEYVEIPPAWNNEVFKVYASSDMNLENKECRNNIKVCSHSFTLLVKKDNN